MIGVQRLIDGLFFQDHFRIRAIIPRMEDCER